VDDPLGFDRGRRGSYSRCSVALIRGTRPHARWVTAGPPVRSPLVVAGSVASATPCHRARPRSRSRSNRWPGDRDSTTRPRRHGGGNRFARCNPTLRRSLTEDVVPALGCCRDRAVRQLISRLPSAGSRVAILDRSSAAGRFFPLDNTAARTRLTRDSAPSPIRFHWTDRIVVCGRAAPHQRSHQPAISSCVSDMSETTGKPRCPHRSPRSRSRRRSTEDVPHSAF